MFRGKFLLNIEKKGLMELATAVVLANMYLKVFPRQQYGNRISIVRPRNTLVASVSFLFIRFALFFPAFATELRTLHVSVVSTLCSSYYYWRKTYIRHRGKATDVTTSFRTRLMS